MEGSRQVLVKLKLFQLRERVQPWDGTTPSFFYESRSSLLVLSINVSFVLKFFWKLKRRANIYGGPCKIRKLYF